MSQITEQSLFLLYFRYKEELVMSYGTTCPYLRKGDTVYLNGDKETAFNPTYTVGYKIDKIQNKIVWSGDDVIHEIHIFLSFLSQPLILKSKQD